MDESISNQGPQLYGRSCWRFWEIFGVVLPRWSFAALFPTFLLKLTSWLFKLLYLYTLSQSQTKTKVHRVPSSRHPSVGRGYNGNHSVIMMIINIMNLNQNLNENYIRFSRSVHKPTNRQLQLTMFLVNSLLRVIYVQHDGTVHNNVQYTMHMKLWWSDRDSQRLSSFRLMLVGVICLSIYYRYTIHNML